MNLRELGLVSAAAIIGAAASALAIRCSFSNPTNHFSTTHCSEKSQNGVVRTKRASSESPFDPSKRKGYLSWEDYFMAMAFLSAESSKDPNWQALAIRDSQEAVQMTDSLGQRLVVESLTPNIIEEKMGEETSTTDGADFAQVRGALGFFSG